MVSAHNLFSSIWKFVHTSRYFTLGIGAGLILLGIIIGGILRLLAILCGLLLLVLGITGVISAEQGLSTLTKATAALRKRV